MSRLSLTDRNVLWGEHARADLIEQIGRSGDRAACSLPHSLLRAPLVMIWIRFPEFPIAPSGVFLLADA